MEDPWELAWQVALRALAREIAFPVRADQIATLTGRPIVSPLIRDTPNLNAGSGSVYRVPQ